MSIKQAIWIHGTAVQAQREGYHINKKKVGWGCEICSHGREWFHFAVPTPVIFGGKNSKLTKAFVLFKTTMTAKIVEVHLWDGKTKFRQFKKLNYHGTHNGKLDKSNTYQVTPRHLKYGLGISICVDFGKSTPSGVPSIIFATAGADFTIPN